MNPNEIDLAAADSPFVGMLDSWMLDRQATEAKARDIWARGLEGVVTKAADSPYFRRRSPWWVRIKQTSTHDGFVLDVMLKSDRLKAVIVRGPDGPVTVATGWSDDIARQIVSRYKMGYRMIAEIAFQQSTGTTRSIRGARFVRLRDDKTPSEGSWS